MLETLKRKLGEALSKLLIKQAQKNPYLKALTLADTGLKHKAKHFKK